MARHFFIVGAQRSGTTWLYRMLGQHPDINMAHPERPEPKFFITDMLYEKGIAYYCQTYFSAGAYAWLGEKSTSYIEQAIAAKRISLHFPDALILFLLRDPVDRAISNYRFSRDNGLEARPLELAIAQEPALAKPASDISVSPYAYTARGHYVRFLGMWEQYFPREQMMLLTSEKLLGSEVAIRDVFGRLHLDTHVPLSNVHLAVNGTAPSSEPVSPNIHRRLREGFRNSNHLLAERYGVDISRWQ
ncbi:MAG: sulfotransferase [Burkholderiaceae bacterium]